MVLSGLWKQDKVNNLYILVWMEGRGKLEESVEQYLSLSENQRELCACLWLCALEIISVFQL